MDIAAQILSKLSSECGVSGLLLFAGLAYQTWTLGKVRQQRDEDRKQIIEDAEARTRAAEAAIMAQQEIALALAAAQSRHRRYEAC